MTQTPYSPATQERLDDGEQVARFDLLDLGSEALPAELKEQLAPPLLTPEGFLIVEGFAARGDNVQVYTGADGGTYREFRPWDAVKASLALYEGRPATNLHPKGLVTAKDAARHARGSVLWAKALDDHKLIHVRAVIHDADTIDDIQEGRHQLSLGYLASVDATPGRSPDGEPFDTRLTAYLPNHLAVVDRARAGHLAQLRLDSSGHHNLGALARLDSEGVMEFITIMMGGKPVRVHKDDAQALQDAIKASDELTRELAQVRKDHDKATADLKAAKDSAEQQEGRAKALDLKLAERSDEAIDKKVAEAAKARLALVLDAADYLGGKTADEVACMAERDIRLAVVKAEFPDAKLDAVTDAELAGWYGAARREAAEGKKGVEKLLGAGLKGQTSTRGQDDCDDATKAHKDAVEAHRDSYTNHKRPLVGGKA